MVKQKLVGLITIVIFITFGVLVHLFMVTQEN